MGKYFFIAFFFVCSFKGYSQGLQIEDTINISRARWRDTCFGLINKSTALIPSGYLLDYSMAAFESGKYDGLASDDDTIKAYGNFFLLHNIINISAVNSNAGLSATDNLFINAHRYKRDTKTIPLVFLFQSYQKINSSAWTNNLFSITSDSLRLLDVTGRPSSPYDNKEIFIFTPLQTQITIHNSIKFSLPASLWLMPGINSVNIDFDDGVGIRSVSKGDSISVYYSTNGKKYISAVISTANGNRTARCMINYKRPAHYFKADTIWNISVTPIYNGTDDYLAQGGGSSVIRNGANLCGAESSIFERVNCDINPGAQILVINGCDRVLDKPIIIIEGFDFDNKVTLEKLFQRFSLVYRFFESMRSAGYDFVFVNFTNPTTFIENNAKVIEEVINKVNANKSGNIRGSIIGHSMGGLIARWCLKDMEDRGIDHKMAHYFSYDSPHQGANIPLGVQYLFGEIENDFPFLTYNNLGGSGIFPEFQFSSAAAGSASVRQMLVTKSNYGNGPFNWNPTLTTLDPVRAIFANKLVQKGYPQNLTRHGIAFGRGNNIINTKQAGNGQQFGNFGPGSKTLEAATTFLLANFFSSVYAVQEGGVNDYICRYRFVGIKIPRVFGVTVGVFPNVRIRNFKYTGNYPYEDAPGGYHNSQTQLVDKLNKYWISSSASNQGHHGHNFMPTVSALDLQNQSYSSTTKWQSNNLFYNIDNNIVNPAQVTGNYLNNASLSPFHFLLTYTSDCGTVPCQSLNDDVNGDDIPDIVNNNWNQFHGGFISNQASQYIQRKILNALPSSACPGLCDLTNTIIGPSSFCTQDNYSLTGSNLSGLSFSWEAVIGKFKVISGQGTPAVRLEKISGGNETIRVVITNSCGSTRTVTLNIRMGGFSSSDYPITGTNPACKNQTVYYQTNNLPGATNYQWTFPTNSGWTYIGGQGTRFLTLKTGTAPGVYPITVRVANACDAGGSPAQFFITVNNCNSFFIASPNPSNGNVNISAVQPQGLGTGAGTVKIYQIKVVDQYGVLKDYYNYPSGVTNTTINLSNLIAGIYTIQSFNGLIWEYKQIVKQ